MEGQGLDSFLGHLVEERQPLTALGPAGCLPLRLAGQRNCSISRAGPLLVHSDHGAEAHHAPSVHSTHKSERLGLLPLECGWGHDPVGSRTLEEGPTQPQNPHLFHKSLHGLVEDKGAWIVHLWAEVPVQHLHGDVDRGLDFSCQQKAEPSVEEPHSSRIHRGHSLLNEGAPKGLWQPLPGHERIQCLPHSEMRHCSVRSARGTAGSPSGVPQLPLSQVGKIMGADFLG